MHACGIASINKFAIDFTLACANYNAPTDHTAFIQLKAHCCLKESRRVYSEHAVIFDQYRYQQLHSSSEVVFRYHFENVCYPILQRHTLDCLELHILGLYKAFPLVLHHALVTLYYILCLIVKKYWFPISGSVSSAVLSYCSRSSVSPLIVYLAHVHVQDCPQNQEGINWFAIIQCVQGIGWNWH